MENKDNKQQTETLEEKIIKLQLQEKLQNSNIYLQSLYTKISFYQKQLEIQIENKPLIFQKKQRKNYQNQIIEYETIIKETYKKIDKEIKLIFELNKQIKN